MSAILICNLTFEGIGAARKYGALAASWTSAFYDCLKFGNRFHSNKFYQHIPRERDWAKIPDSYYLFYDVDHTQKGMVFDEIAYLARTQVLKSLPFKSTKQWLPEIFFMIRITVSTRSPLISASCCLVYFNSAPGSRSFIR